MRQAIAIFIVLVTVALTAFLVTHKLSNPDHYAYGYCPPRVCTSFREADAGTRTPDPIITSDVLYQLSYVGGGTQSSPA